MAAWISCGQHGIALARRSLAFKNRRVPSANGRMFPPWGLIAWARAPRARRGLRFHCMHDLGDMLLALSASVMDMELLTLEYPMRTACSSIRMSGQTSARADRARGNGRESAAFASRAGRQAPVDLRSRSRARPDPPPAKPIK
jgi:hypothetical protein